MSGVSGWSLVEVLIAVALTALLASSSAFSWRQWRQELALQAAAQQVVGDLALVRLRAAATNRSHRLLLPEGSATYRLQARNGTQYEDVQAPRPLPLGVTVKSCNAAGSAFTYRPRGNAATFGTLVLRNQLYRERSIVVDIAGRVRIQ